MQTGCYTPQGSVCRGRKFDHFSFLWHNVGSSYARKPIKGSKDSDDSLVSRKKLERKYWLIGLAPKAG